MWINTTCYAYRSQGASLTTVFSLSFYFCFERGVMNRFYFKREVAILYYTCANGITNTCIFLGTE